jgi:hypothetical protein
MSGDYIAKAVSGSVPDLEEARVRAASLEPETWRGAEADGAHDIFLVSHVPVPQSGNPRHRGVEP